MADDDELHRKRQGFWLRVAREANNLNQLGAARLIGLKTKSAISDYENGVTEIPGPKLRKLAKEYGWPLVMFTEPMKTGEELARERMARLARAAIRVAGQDVEAEDEAGAPAGDGGHAEPPRTQLA
jgi:transcriptional regulator with XRE-family HTH domain